MTDFYTTSGDVLDQVRGRLAAVAVAQNRPVSANDFTPAESLLLGNRAGQVFNTPYFTRLEQSVVRTKASANRRRIFLYQFIG